MTKNLPPEDLEQVESYRQIQERKQLLKRVVAITQALERMQQGLQAVLHLGEAAAEIDIPASQLRFFEKFRQRMASESNARLQQYLLRLQTLVSQELRQILQFSQIDPEDARMEQLASSEGQRLLREFQRRAQTAVGLRVLLAERGVALPKAVIPVPRRKLQAQLQNLRGKERLQRKRVESQILEMRSELQILATSEQLPAAFRAELGAALQGLEEDLAKLRSGQSLSQVTLSFEAVQAEAVSLDESEPVLLEVARARDLPQGAAQGSDEVLPQAGWRGFFGRLLRWLNSPWRVSWREIKQTERKPR